MKNRFVMMVGFGAVAVLLLGSTLAYAATNQSPSGDATVKITTGASATTQVLTRTKASWPWYVTRASGMTAAILLILLMLSGVGLLTGYTYKFLEPLTAWASHRAMGLAFGAAVLLHMFSLLFDHFVPFNILQVFVPFLSPYKPLTIFGHNIGSTYVALGVMSFYLILAIIVSSLLWIDKKPHTWKLLHYLSYVTIVFVFVHALFLGTDLSHGLFRWIWIVLGMATLVSIISRLRRAWTI